MIPKAAEVRLTPEDRAVLEARLRAPTTEQRDVLRARIVLLAAEGRSTQSIASTVGTMPRTVSVWRGRFARQGLAGLGDKPRPGRAPKYGAETGRRILAVLEQPPPAGFARWTGPLIAAELGNVHEQQVWRFLRVQKIDLSGRKSWCESDDPGFAAKAADVVGLYMAPPENAIVICVDEKPSIQALERAQGYLKLPNDSDRPQPPLQAQRHLDPVRRLRGGHRQGDRRAQEAPATRRIPRFHERHRRPLSGHGHPCRPRQPQYPQAQERPLAQASPERAFHYTPRRAS
jgi:transposase